MRRNTAIIYLIAFILMVITLSMVSASGLLGNAKLENELKKVTKALDVDQIQEKSLLTVVVQLEKEAKRSGSFIPASQIKKIRKEEMMMLLRILSSTIDPEMNPPIEVITFATCFDQEMSDSKDTCVSIQLAVSAMNACVHHLGKYSSKFISSICASSNVIPQECSIPIPFCIQ